MEQEILAYTEEGCEWVGFSAQLARQTGELRALNVLKTR